MRKVVILPAEEKTELVAQLFREYARDTLLGIDLRFQGFEEELAALPGVYAPPSGRLYLAFLNDEAAGCAAMRKFSEGVCEMKRLYVRPQFRDHGIAESLCKKIMGDARKIGYTTMVLDTLNTLTAANALYAKLGFREISPYYNNPLAGVRYLGISFED
ncbi:MAG: GNAT family N-acetyltransferase [Oscillospiraceae bacterium]|nr:GNAT family N-acetyltransferase [Oscillospiraceae bacterium]